MLFVYAEWAPDARRVIYRGAAGVSGRQIHGCRRGVADDCYRPGQVRLQGPVVLGLGWVLDLALSVVRVADEVKRLRPHQCSVVVVPYYSIY